MLWTTWGRKNLRKLLCRQNGRANMTGFKISFRIASMLKSFLHPNLFVSIGVQTVDYCVRTGLSGRQLQKSLRRIGVEVIHRTLIVRCPFVATLHLPTVSSMYAMYAITCFGVYRDTFFACCGLPLICKCQCQVAVDKHYTKRALSELKYGFDRHCVHCQDELMKDFPKPDMI